jgi:hypothetical protein
MASNDPQRRYTPLDPKKYPKKIWEKHPDETSTGFKYFKAYRDMGEFGERRSLEKTAKMFGVGASNLTYYSAPCNWIKRCEAYDAYLDVELGKEKMKALKAMTKRQVNNLRAANTALMLPINELLVRFRNNPQLLRDLGLGDLLEFTNKNANVLTRMIDAERKVNDQPSEIVKNEFGEGAPQIIVARPTLTPKLQERISNRYEVEEDASSQD